MFYCNLEHVVKKAVQTQSGKTKKSGTASGRFHYITRTLRFERHKENIHETLEFVRSGNLPDFAKGNPGTFWQATDMYERSNGRTCSSLVIALPKELTVEQRIELAEAFIEEFADRYRYPFTCAIHNHPGSFGGQAQPHLHFMYSERHVDGIERTAEQFFKRYNPKEPQKGGAQKLTADVLGMGKGQLKLYRKKTEDLINESLKRYAPTKILEIKGIPVEVPGLVSCLSNEDYNKKYGTQLKDVPIMLNKVRFAKENQPDLVAEREQMKAEIQQIREENHYELYQTYYLAELARRKALEAEHKQKLKDEKRQKEQDDRVKYLEEALMQPATGIDDLCKKDRLRAEYYDLTPVKNDLEILRERALEKIQQLKDQMIQSLRDTNTVQSPDLIRDEFSAYIETVQNAGFDRVTNLQMINQLFLDLSHEVTQDPQHVLQDVCAVREFLLAGKSIQTYVKTNVLQKSEKESEQSYRYDDPSF
nr:MobA/MobL family protein [Acinetobacter sp. YH12142]